MRRTLSLLTATLLGACSTAAPPTFGDFLLANSRAGIASLPEGENEEARHEHVVNGFVGGVTADRERVGAALGLDYERRLGEQFGAGGFVEWVLEEKRTFSAGAQFYWHPYDEFLLAIGPGLERAGGEWGAILRIGAGYEVPLGGGWILTPEAFYDFSEYENLFIWGINVGRGF